MLRLTPVALAVIAGIVLLALAVLTAAWLDGPEFIEIDRAAVGTVFIRPADVSAILGPGEVVLDDGAGTRHNAHAQVVVGGVLRINVAGTAAQVHEQLTR